MTSISANTIATTTTAFSITTTTTSIATTTMSSIATTTISCLTYSLKAVLWLQ